MNEEKLNGLCYTAPRLEVTSFRTESGYAFSAGTEEFINGTITFGS